MSNGRKQSTSQHKKRKPQSHLPKVGSKEQRKWDQERRGTGLEFPTAIIVAVVILAIVLVVIAYVV